MTPDTLRAATGCTAEAAAKYADPLSAACAFYGIDTPTRLAAFLAQIGHESGSLRYASELWGPTHTQLRYEGRASLGNTQPGDGERFKGHGLIQTTGRFNHARVRDRLRERFPDVPDFEADPEALTQPQWACLSAADYWDDRGLNELADAGQFEAITRKINGGFNGQADRLTRWERAKKALFQNSPEPKTAAISQEAPMPIPAIILAALPALFNAIPELVRTYGSASAMSERNAKGVEILATVAKEALGAKNEQEAAEMVEADPAAAQTLREAVKAQWFEIVEAGSGGIDGARKADVAFVANGGPVWQSPAFLISLVLLAMPIMLLVDVFYVHADNYQDELRTQIVTGVLMTIGIVGGYWLGSSFGSQRKTELSGK